MRLGDPTSVEQNTMKRRLLTSLTTVLGILALAGIAFAAVKVKITKSRFRYDTGTYFRGLAENVVLGSYGEKKTPVNRPNYVAVQGDLPPAKLAKFIKISGPYDIDWSRHSKGNVSGNIKFLKKGGGTGKFSRDAAKRAKLKLIKLHLDEGSLLTVLNKRAPKVRSYLKREGRDARIVSTVWIAMEADLASDIEQCGEVKANAKVKGIPIEIDTKRCTKSKSSVTIPPNTTFAYGLHKVKRWTKRKKAIRDLEDDYPGLN